MSAITRCQTLDDLRALARRRLPWSMWEFLEGGSDDEVCLERNRSAFAAAMLLPRACTDTSALDLTTKVVGHEISWPVALAPTGMNRMYHGHGECAVARAAAESATLYALSTFSSQSLEKVAAAAEGPKIFQLFTAPGWERSLSLVDRAQAAGYDILCVTVDTAAPPNKERDLRTGVAAGGVTPRALASILGHPRWVAGLVRGGGLRLANLDVGATEAKQIQWRESDRLTWERIERLRDRWRGPFVLKGILRPDDATRAAALGADAIIASNHGGRQLDTAAAPFEQLPALVDAAGGRMEVWIDSGIRRGTDVIKALGLGASLCLIGRPYLYGLAAGGEAGVRRVIALLREELERDLKLVGAASVAELDRSFVALRTSALG